MINSSVKNCIKWLCPLSLSDYDSPIFKKKPVIPADTLWIYGDSVAQRFLKSLIARSICKTHFQKCTSSYMWIYEVTKVHCMLYAPLFYSISLIADWVVDNQTDRLFN